MEQLISKHWHHCPADEVATLLSSNTTKGLSIFEAKHRLEKFGPNMVSAKKQKSRIVQFLQQFNQPLVYILLLAGFVTLFLRKWVDSSVIFGVVILNAIIGYVQEAKAERAIESLKQMMTTQATVFRDGKWTSCDSTQLVAGDVIKLQSGDKVPADTRLFNCRKLQVDESALTGESVPVLNKAETLPPETILADRYNMVYAGTLVTYGQAQALIVSTGDKTETGRISEMLASATDLATPFTKKNAAFSKVLLIVILALATVTFAVGMIRGEAAIDMFMAAVALAVGAIPDGLPAAVTITLAVGVNRLARKKAIIRKLPAVETFGSTTVICSDKTGTLTENQMTVRMFYSGDSVYSVEGNGYAPTGDILSGKAPLKTLPAALYETLLAGLLCDDSRLVNAGNFWRVEGDPNEGALLSAAGKAGLDSNALHARLPRMDVVPFDSERQFMATLHKTASGENVIYVKGALEKVLEACTDGISADGGIGLLEKAAVLSEATRLASEGLRVLIFARKTCKIGVSLAVYGVIVTEKWMRQSVFIREEKKYAA